MACQQLSNMCVLTLYSNTLSPSSSSQTICDYYLHYAGGEQWLVVVVDLPLISTWSHLRCDVGLDEGNIEKKLSLCYSIVYCDNGAQRYEQFLQVG